MISHRNSSSPEKTVKLSCTDCDTFFSLYFKCNNDMCVRLLKVIYTSLQAHTKNELCLEIFIVGVIYPPTRSVESIDGWVSPRGLE